ncbi:MAG: HDOD domain-containing protein, partial [Gammaproteobacteria bacterium]|nr:HDOD domain-containing protein [Gammaproteobacteria bacterium]NIR94259.1 HDOD domain-containing protein [Gammaproteobacteria bacterium]NIX57907.1 HDOD domain-containing protein [candidate division Zixibacteria bacterium]
QKKVKGSFDIARFWKHCIGTAVAARLIASYRREANIEKYFVMGLLHDIGRVVIMMIIPEYGVSTTKKAAEEERPLHLVEKEVLDFDHAQVGGELLRQWKLPGNLIDSISNHHYPSKSRDYYNDAALLHISEIISNCLEVVRDHNVSVPDVEKGAWEAMGLPESMISSL